MQKENTMPTRLPYSSPELQVYGDIGVLTRATARTGTVTDHTGGTHFNRSH